MSDFWDGTSPRAVIALDNVIGTYQATSNNETSIFLGDFLTTTQYSTVGGSFSITGFFDETEQIDFIAIGSGNWVDAQAIVTVEYRGTSGSYFEVGAFSFTNRANNQPVLITFSPSFAIGVRISVNKPGGLPIEITTLTAGKLINFPKVPDVGHQPAIVNSLNEITDSATEGNAFGPARVNARGNEEIAPFSDLAFTWIKSEIPRLIDWQGKPIFFAWNIDDAPTEVICGRWELSPISYGSVLHGGVNLVVRGLV